jgi:hypothetical protein
LSWSRVGGFGSSRRVDRTRKWEQPCFWWCWSQLCRRCWFSLSIHRTLQSTLVSRTRVSS